MLSQLTYLTIFLDGLTKAIYRAKLLLEPKYKGTFLMC